VFRSRFVHATVGWVLGARPASSLRARCDGGPAAPRTPVPLPRIHEKSFQLAYACTCTPGLSLTTRPTPIRAPARPQSVKAACLFFSRFAVRTGTFSSTLISARAGLSSRPKPDSRRQKKKKLHDRPTRRGTSCCAVADAWAVGRRRIRMGEARFSSRARGVDDV
jgi:hypothetical protein